MESSITFPTAFDPKFEKSAELIAYLTNGIAYRDNGDIRVAGKSELNKIIAEKYEQKDFIGASKILEDVKKTFETTSEELAERVSRSIRVPAPTYLKLVETALRGEVSLASVMRTVVLGPAIKSALDELSTRPEVVPDRLSRVKAVFEDWNDSESAKQDPYSLDFICEHSLKLSELLNRYAEFEFFRRCDELNVPKKAAKLYLSSIAPPPSNLYFNWLMIANDCGFREAYAMLIAGNKISITVKDGDFVLGYALGIGCDYENVFATVAGNIRREFGQQVGDSILAAISSPSFEESRLYVEEGEIVTMSLNFYSVIAADGDRVYLDGIEVCEKNRNAIAENILTQHLYGTILDEQRTQKEVQNAIDADDLDKASDLSKKLAEYSVRMGVSEWITNSLFSAIETSEVITFTIPPIFIPILNSLQENKQIPDLVEQYLQKGQVNADF